MAHDDVEDECDDADHQHRHRPQRGQQGRVAVGDDASLLAAAEQDAMQGDRGEGDDRAERRGGDEEEVEPALPVGQIAEGRLKGEGEEEAGEDLRARLQDAQLLEHLDPVAVIALGGALVPPVTHVIDAGGIPVPRGSRRRGALLDIDHPPILAASSGRGQPGTTVLRRASTGVGRAELARVRMAGWEGGVA
jgi:hypothetical protein